jgi:hypothetical protein
VAKSIDRIRYNKKTHDNKAIAIGYYNLVKIMTSTPNVAVMTLNYEDMVREPIWAVETIARFCKCSPTQAAINWINPEYKHF